MHFAHSIGDTSRRDWQTLPDHLDAVGRLAAAWAAKFGMENAGRFAGRFHDIGKCTEGFDLRLEGGPAVEHSLAGAFLIRQRGGTPIERAMAELIAYESADRNDDAGQPSGEPEVSPSTRGRGLKCSQ
ncbi:CRISPR-associated endonuclease Cas3'' [Pleomorphomonas koreensis]|uniref:CRISPR-associated endonuclease Cas3'' n=1 Tax=Pleomorphomonas koreensis TaxID=257440 RepID=UPI0004203A25|nr:CRISPR-associated endonuclease Cas3'' [Pleomorphomonas koreensis]